MVVYSASRKKYVLSARPAFSAADGEFYDVKENQDLQVKLYKKAYRTAEKQQEIIEAINGESSMLGEFPQDLVYANGKFAGYLTKCQYAPAPDNDLVPPVPAPPPTRKLSNFQLSMICGAIGSVLIYFLFFGMLCDHVPAVCCKWNFHGIPMILLGWVGLLTAYFHTRKHGRFAVVSSALAFAAASGLAFALISLLSWALFAITHVPPGSETKFIIITVVVLTPVWFIGEFLVSVYDRFF